MPLSSSIQPTLSPLPNSTSSSTTTPAFDNTTHLHHISNKDNTIRPSLSSVGGGTFEASSSDSRAAGESHRPLSTSSNDDPRTTAVLATTSAGVQGGTLTGRSAAATIPTTTTTTTTTTSAGAVATADPGEVIERGSSRSSLALSPTSSSDQQPLTPHHVSEQQQTEGTQTAAAAGDQQHHHPQQQQEQQPSRPISPSTTKRQSRSSTRKQTLLTKALLNYLKLFRIVQPLVSLGTLGTMLPVLLYFRTQTIFPAIQASLYLYTVTLACASFLFAVIYLVDVLYRKPLFWPFTNKHFRPSSRARISGDLMICMAFCGMWFLALVGLVIDAAMVDCQKIGSLDVVFIIDNPESGSGHYRQDIEGMNRFHRICQLEKASMGLAVICWACWMGVLLLLLYGHFWKRRQVIAERLRRSLGRRHRHNHGAADQQHHQDNHQQQPSQQHSSPHDSLDDRDARLKSGYVHSHSSATRAPLPGEAATGTGAGVGGSGTTSTSGGGPYYDTQRSYESDHYACQNQDGEVGLTGIICHYDGDSLRDRSSLRTAA
ncbi:hypothetical protein BGW41_007715 [Actinomortierella wolfii]|nr:hypothetical protein BGW41_007715 [Actinomortierella wolfii]